MRTSAIFLPWAAALLITATAATAAVPQPPNCGLLTPRASREYPIPGTGLLAVDPYGGVYSRSQNFAFRVRGTSEALAGIAQVIWTLDGVKVRVDPTGPRFAWWGYTSAMSP